MTQPHSTADAAHVLEKLRGSFIMLSSGAAQRYRDDIIRALALPRGGILQFRYRRDELVAPEVQRLLGRDLEIRGAETLVCYLDRADPSQTPEVVPCRFATIAGVEELGGTIVISLRTMGFPIWRNLHDLNEDMRAADDLDLGVMPYWHSQDNTRVSGHFWLARRSLPQALERQSQRNQDLGAFESIVTELAGRRDFENESVFFHFCGIIDRKSGRYGDVQDGFQILAGSRQYGAVFYHFRPELPGAGVQLDVATTVTRIAFTSPPTLDIDSRYDRKTIYFSTTAAASVEEGVLTVVRSVSEPTITPQVAIARTGGATPHIDGAAPETLKTTFLAVPLRVKSTRGKAVFIAVVIGFLLFCNQAIATLSNDKLEAATKVRLLLAQFVISIVIGLTASFGIQKPL